MERGSNSKTGKGKSPAESSEIPSIVLELNGRDKERNPGDRSLITSYFLGDDKNQVFKGGYRWQRYEQGMNEESKILWNSYNCLHPGCSVKMHAVGPVFNSDKITTYYEGEHTHGSSSSYRHYLGSTVQLNSNYGISATHTMNYGQSSNLSSFPCMQTHPSFRAIGGGGQPRQASVHSAHGSALHVPQRGILGAPADWESHRLHRQSSPNRPRYYNFMGLPQEQPPFSDAQRSHGLLELHQSSLSFSAQKNEQGINTSDQEASIPGLDLKLGW